MVHTKKLEFFYNISMNTILRLLSLIAALALWEQAQAYEISLDIKVAQEAVLGTQSAPKMSGHAWLIVGEEKTPIALDKLKLAAPSTKSMDSEEWVLTWLGDAAPEIMEQMAHGLNRDLITTEIDLRRHKLRCKGTTQVKCRGEISLKLTLRRS